MLQCSMISCYMIGYHVAMCVYIMDMGLKLRKCMHVYTHDFHRSNVRIGKGPWFVGAFILASGRFVHCLGAIQGL